MLPTDTVPVCHVVPEGVQNHSNNLLVCQQLQSKVAWTAEMPLQWFPVWKELATANTEEHHPWVQAVEDVAGVETQAVKQPTLSGILHQDLDRESMEVRRLCGQYHCMIKAPRTHQKM